MDLVEKWRRNNRYDVPENYQPKVCPPDQAEVWTNTRNPGSSDYSKWEWDLLVDLAYVSDTTPNTVKDNVEVLLEGLSEEELTTLAEELE